ncbi:MAG TPA: FKBP-type peptidyl-prolyl cis-trans isomerase [Protaetiibacter sp.]|nr:FKBP-type peptidyl-prolyl cis-trans isomerase [Protaetiibacter sp.]
MPRVLPILTVAALAVALAGCSTGEPDTSSTPDAAGDECVGSGSVSDAVDVSGDFGAAPTVSFDAPLALDATERTVAIEGDGDAIERGSTASLQFTLYNGTTGDVVTQTDYTTDAETISVDGLLPGLESTLICSTVGSRVVGVVPAAEGFGDAGNQQLGVEAGQSLVFVLDVIDLIPSAADAMIEWTTNVPKVVRADDGTPTITLPETDPPADLMLTVLTEGDGAEVGDGDNVTVDYLGMSWNTGEVFDQSFGKTPATFATTGVVPGFGAALVGQKVGSTVLVTIPPIYAYGTDPNAAQLGGQTLVFLIDIKDSAAN